MGFPLQLFSIDKKNVDVYKSWLWMLLINGSSNINEALQVNGFKIVNLL